MSVIRVIAIDPGAINCGIAIMDMDYTGAINLVYVNTITTQHYLKSVKDIVQMHGERFARNTIIGRIVTELMLTYNPRVVACEAAYLSHYPEAFKALVETITTLKNTIFNYDESIHFHLLEASVVKANLNVKGDSGDKSLMLNALLAKTLINCSVDLNTLDEHSIDAIAIGICQCNILNSI